MKWVESNPEENGFGGGGGAQWIEVSKARRSILTRQDNIEAWVNVAGSLLGALTVLFVPNSDNQVSPRL